MQATIGVDFLTKMCRFNGYKYKLELWDTAGQEKYRSLIKGYLRGANACVFVYDQSSNSTST
jgi:small GTP-binding protein